MVLPVKLQNKFFLTLFLAVLGLTSCLPKEDHPLNGYYEFTHPTGVIVPGGSGTNCSPYWKGMKGLCILDYNAVNQLGLKVLKNGDLKFATRLSFFNGHSCGLRGVAKQTEDGWLYQEKTGECKLNIFLDEDLIVLNSDEDATCQNYCGSNGSFSNSHFPTTLKVKDSISDEALDCISEASENCKKLAEREQ